VAVDFKQALGRIIATLRARQGLSQEALAYEAGVDRTRIGEIERGEANATIDTLVRIASTLEQTLGSLILQAEDLAAGTIRRPAPTANPDYLDRAVPLPTGLTHDQLLTALNRAMAILAQIDLMPGKDIQANIFSGVVSNIVTKAIAECSAFVQHTDTAHPDLYNPSLPTTHPDWGLEMKAGNEPGKGAESHNPGHGWFMIVIYAVREAQTHIVQVEAARLEDSDWTIHERAETSKRTRTAITRSPATKRLRANSAYMHPEYLTKTVAAAIAERRQGTVI
jgi:transcriptional regulator with XRE-family HTH domain